MNDYIFSEDDFLDNINHFKRHVYYKAALDANSMIEKVTGKRLKERSLIIKITDGLGRVVRCIVNPKSKLYLFMRKYYHKIRGGRPE